MSAVEMTQLETHIKSHPYIVKPVCIFRLILRESTYYKTQAFAKGGNPH